MDQERHTRWAGCYKDGWKGLIVSDTPAAHEQLTLLPGESYNAFEHPAKVSRRLAQRLYEHLRDVYGLRPGSVVIDPFCGVGCLGMDALFVGYHYVGVDIEEKFATLAQTNVAYWKHRFGVQPGSVTVLQGDSRELRKVLAGMQIGGLVSSPPYADGCRQVGHDFHPERMHSPLTGMLRHDYGYYGPTNGNLGNLPVGDLTFLSSPVYAGAGEVLGTHNGIDYSKGKNTGQHRTPGRMNIETGYGKSSGQLGAFPTGELTVLSSPPYANSDQDYADGWSRIDLTQRVHQRYSVQMESSYGTSPGQLGNTTGPTFWSESARVMAEVAAILSPGFLAVWIVKAFVRDNTIVDFPAQWQQLCEQQGFTTIEIIHASLIEHHGEELSLFGETVTRQTKRVGFFRRLAEKKGAPSIDEEIVLITERKP